MPNRDGKGPLGDGRPGRGLGNCGKGHWTGSEVSGETGDQKRGLIDYGVEFVAYLLKSIMNKNTNKRS